MVYPVLHALAMAHHSEVDPVEQLVEVPDNEPERDPPLFRE